MNQNQRVVFLASGAVIAALVWLLATASSPDRMVSAEFVALDVGLILIVTLVGGLWPKPVVVPPLTEEQLATLLDSRYLRSGQPLPKHNHPELEHQPHDHLTNSTDAAGPRTGAPDYNVVTAAPAGAGGPRVI